MAKKIEVCCLVGFPSKHALAAMQVFRLAANGQGKEFLFVDRPGVMAWHRDKATICGHGDGAVAYAVSAYIGHKKSERAAEGQRISRVFAADLPNSVDEFVRLHSMHSRLSVVFPKHDLPEEIIPVVNHFTKHCSRTCPLDTHMPIKRQMTDILSFLQLSSDANRSLFEAITTRGTQAFNFIDMVESAKRRRTAELDLRFPPEMSGLNE